MMIKDTRIWSSIELKTARTLLGLTQQEVADISRMTKAGIWAIETGKSQSESSRLLLTLIYIQLFTEKPEMRESIEAASKIISSYRKKFLQEEP